MPRLQASVSLQSVAAAAGVSAMTVSRVLNRSPHVRAATRRKVEAVVKKLGYRPDPQIAHLMARVREHRLRRAESVIAVVRDDIPEDKLHDPAYQYVSTQDIRSRAEQHGYRAEEFFLGRGGITAKRLVSILTTRGIEGLIISPQSSLNIGTQLDYSRFAAATFGYGLPFPALHRASTNMTHGILQATAELSARGYRRIGLAVTEWVDDRSDHTYSGAMLNFQQKVPPEGRVPLLLFPENNLSQGAGIFCAWFKEHQPDVIISFDAYVQEWLTRRLKVRIPEDVGLVVHDWVERHSSYAGIHHRRSHVAAAAVDLLATQLTHNERGIPAVPRQILIPPAWIDGTSVRPRSSTDDPLP